MAKSNMSVSVNFAEKAFDRKLRQVFHVIKRTMDRDGQLTAVSGNRSKCILAVQL
ncbi:hypothetical protein OB236_14030 [Paenibacillus sp. WQ 127069]|uniref:Uncharacterized protein n=1 Tax=Paenibacillus baimaensis TaxID=2982185 RepID=A0ABT2UF12_9BACL|nr:hypothetical protein [Paenibacillus sp. WQ 127069]MCU6793235.1 hypothetical protein [Paenibacillus sp. WQ 127069]